MREVFWSIAILLGLLSGCAKVGGIAPSLLGGGDGSGIETEGQPPKEPSPASEPMAEQFRCSNAEVEIVVYEASSSGFALIDLKRWNGSAWVYSATQTQQTVSGGRFEYEARGLSLEITASRLPNYMAVLEMGNPTKIENLQCSKLR